MRSKLLHIVAHESGRESLSTSVRSFKCQHDKLEAAVNTFKDRLAILEARISQ